ncbi:D-3-phosphoglycerate dehydrogenase [Synergistales bacterium]|nr:D-3-phosphoglycerate dehydrogenase [Synergistales bacterium]
MGSLRVLASDGMNKTAVQELTKKGYDVVEQFYAPEELGEQLRNFDALVIRSATKVRKPIIDKAAEAGRLKIVIRAGVGIDNVDVEYAQSKGIIVKNTPNASTNSVAELVIGSLFSLARFVYDANQTMHEGKWEKKRYEGIEIAGKTLGVAGMGRIGRSVAKKAAALGMSVVYTDIVGHLPENEPFKFMSLDEVLASSDFITLHMGGADKPVLDAENFAKIKRGAFLINAARGSLIDEAALLAALESGQLAAAALDVFAEEPCKNEKIYTHPKILLTPHIGASTVEAQSRIGDELVQIITGCFA